MLAIVSGNCVKCCPLVQSVGHSNVTVIRVCSYLLASRIFLRLLFAALVYLVDASCANVGVGVCVWLSLSVYLTCNAGHGRGNDFNLWTCLSTTSWATTRRSLNLPSTCHRNLFPSNTYEHLCVRMLLSPLNLYSRTNLNFSVIGKLQFWVELPSLNESLNKFLGHTCNTCKALCVIN